MDLKALESLITGPAGVAMLLVLAIRFMLWPLIIAQIEGRNKDQNNRITALETALVATQASERLCQETLSQTRSELNVLRGEFNVIKDIKLGAVQAQRIAEETNRFKDGAIPG